MDFDAREVLIRETYQHGRTEYTKNDGSQREIHMSQPVVDALMAMRPAGYAADARRFDGTYVFRTKGGHPIDNSNFVDRVWTPLLRSLGLAYRRPYDMRHTCATLWLAAEVKRPSGLHGSSGTRRRRCCFVRIRATCPICCGTMAARSTVWWRAQARPRLARSLLKSNKFNNRG